MKGKDLQAIVRAMPDEVLKRLEAVVEGLALPQCVRLLHAYRTQKPYADKTAKKDLAISSRTLHSNFEALLSLLVQTWAATCDDGFSNPFVSVGFELVDRTEFEAAEAIVREGLLLASQYEEFEDMLNLLNIWKRLPQTKQEDVVSQAELIPKPAYRLELKQAIIRIRNFRVRSAAEQKAILEKTKSLIDEGRSRFVGDELGVRNDLLHTRLRFLSKWHTDDHFGALELHREFFRQLQANQWLANAEGFSAIQEHSRLVKLLYLNGQTEEAESQAFRLVSTKCASATEEFEKNRHLHPFRLTVALNEGNLTVGADALSQVKSFTSSRLSEPYPSQRISNLYLVAYYEFAIGEFSEAYRTIRQLARFQRKHFDHYLWPLTRMLECFIQFETGDIEGANRSLVNFRKSPFYKQSPFFKIALGLLQRLISAPEDDHKTIRRNYQSKLQAAAIASELALNDFFNIEAWNESHLSDQLMVDVFRITQPSYPSLIARSS